MPSDMYDREPRPASGSDDGGASSPATFEALVGDYLDDLFADMPASATFQGWAGLDDRSPDLGATAFEDRDARADHWDERFARWRDEDLTPDQRIDRDLVRSVLRARRIRRDRQEWRRDPDQYLNPALMGVFTLFLRRPLPEPELVEAASARLRAVPAMLDAGRANLDPDLASPVLVQRALGQCRAGERYARELLRAEVSDAGLRDRLDEAGTVAADAFAGFAVHLADLAETARGDWALGEERYSALLREAELLGMGAGELQARGEAAWRELDAEMTELAAAIDPTASGWREVVATCSSYRPGSPEEMREAYADETERTRAFLAEYELVTFPEGEHCEVVPSPPFQRPVLAVASYFQPPAFARSRVGRFNVPYPPDGTTAEDLSRRLADNSYHSIPTITAHEAYPGHHWHLTTMQDASPLRRIHRSTYFTEGWGLYAELLMREAGYFTDPRDELMHLNARIFRAARIVVDTALHGGDMTTDQAVQHMQDKVGLTEPVARAEVARYCAWPTQAAAYLTGCLEIERLRERWRRDPDRDGGLRHLHDTLAASGSLPPALAERAVFGA